ncbi:hypothetical protein PO909_024025 [Leuciscus waleckii]
MPSKYRESDSRVAGELSQRSFSRAAALGCMNSDDDTAVSHDSPHDNCDRLESYDIEDYEDELAERVRTRTQGEKETIRDFAFTYRALCNRWKPNLTETEVVKLILKNIKPHLASQLRSRVTTVEELVKLGHQLEKDYEQKQQYGTCVSNPSFPDVSQKPTNRTADKPSSVDAGDVKDITHLETVHIIHPLLRIHSTHLVTEGHFNLTNMAANQPVML